MIANRYQPLETAKPGMPMRARDMETAQTVVLHTLAGLGETLGAVQARAERARGIFHPFLITVFDCLVIDLDTLLLACEFVPARSLRTVGGGQPFHLRRAAEIVSEVADGVAELHAHGFAHGAISVDSAFLTEKGRAKLDLVGAVRAGAGGAEGADVRALAALLKELTGQPIVGLRRFTSAAALSAHIRTFASTPR